ncbi:hypothetical protein RIVERRIDER_5 [Xanthomonas phage RiverRider]|uniref:Uncharacterized protein n=1 Tax=Xanthomonas phage RiverRider TaxID=2108116 RepID=A0A2P1JUU1_9CAUD|nr:hypothetical protein HWB58_gp05 [Xanthomonas phage RiverRider]AVO23093.1 hypothetical protein RIVERRIDER_5 [Xanthomonas phage RiverRider]
MIDISVSLPKKCFNYSLGQGPFEVNLHVSYDVVGAVHGKEGLVVVLTTDHRILVPWIYLKAWAKVLAHLIRYY